MREKLKIHDGDTPGKVIEVKLEYPKPKVATMSEKIEDIELGVRNIHGWFELDTERLRGFIVALQNQGVITQETSNWLSLQVDNLSTHFKGLEIQYYKAKELIKGGNNE